MTRPSSRKHGLGRSSLLGQHSFLMQQALLNCEFIPIQAD